MSYMNKEPIIELNNAEQFTEYLVSSHKKLKKNDYEQLENICTDFIEEFKINHPELLEPSEEFGGTSEFEYYLETIRAMREIRTKR